MPLFFVSLLLTAAVLLSYRWTVFRCRLLHKGKLYYFSLNHPWEMAHHRTEKVVVLMNYTPLWIKTDYSILSSLIKIDDLISMLKSLEIKSAAICDDNLYGAMEFYTKCFNDCEKNIAVVTVYHL